MIGTSYVVELHYFDGAPQVVYFGTHGFTTRPTDTPADTTILGRVLTPALVRRDIFDIRTVGGASRVGYGELVLKNEDGALDWLKTVAVDGRDLVVRYGDSPDVAFPAAYAKVFTGTMEELEFTLDAVKVRLRDRQVITLSPLQPELYDGSNVLPDGVEGLESDLKGKPKPVLRGACFNVTPVDVNSSKLIRHASKDPIRDVAAVYDSGALLARNIGPAYTSQVEIEATAPSEGEFQVWKDGGMIRLGSAPIGQLTMDVIEGTTPNDRTAAAMYRRCLVDAGVSLGTISAADCAALDAANRATLGLYYTEEIKLQQVLDDICRSVGAWWGTDKDGIWRIRRLEAPSGTPAFTLTQTEIEEDTLHRVPLNNDGIPVHRVTVAAVENYTPQTTGLAGNVSAARRARLAQRWQDAVAEDLTIAEEFLLSPELRVESKLSCLTAAQVEANRLLALHGVRRDCFEFRLIATAAKLAAVDLGVVIQLTYDRFGLDAGQLFVIIGYQLDPTAGTIDVTVWG